MRYQFTSEHRPLRLAKALRSALKAHGIDFSVSKCQSTLALMLSYRDWHDLRASIDPDGRLGPDDADVPAHVVAERQLRQRAVLVDAGVPTSVVDKVVSAVHPTSSTKSAYDPLSFADIVKSATFRKVMERLSRSEAEVMEDWKVNHPQVHAAFTRLEANRKKPSDSSTESVVTDDLRRRILSSVRTLGEDSLTELVRQSRDGRAWTKVVVPEDGDTRTLARRVYVDARRRAFAVRLGRMGMATAAVGGTYDDGDVVVRMGHVDDPAMGLSELPFEQDVCNRCAALRLAEQGPSCVTP